jgi:hypothetical protein
MGQTSNGWFQAAPINTRRDVTKLLVQDIEDWLEESD